MSFFRPLRVLGAATVTLASSVVLTSPAQAIFMSASGNTYIARSHGHFYYRSDVGEQRITGRVKVDYDSESGEVTGRFTDYSTNGEGCVGNMRMTRLRRDPSLGLIRDAYFDVEDAAPNHRCSSIGQRFSVQLNVLGAQDVGFFMLWSDSPHENIPLYRDVETDRTLNSYGIRGDRVTLLSPFEDLDNARLEVQFPSGVRGWVDRRDMLFDMRKGILW